MSVRKNKVSRPQKVASSKKGLNQYKITKSKYVGDVNTRKGLIEVEVEHILMMPPPLSKTNKDGKIVKPYLEHHMELIRGSKDSPSNLEEYNILLEAEEADGKEMASAFSNLKSGEAFRKSSSMSMLNDEESHYDDSDESLAANGLAVVGSPNFRRLKNFEPSNQLIAGNNSVV